MGLSPERSNESGAAPKATKSGASPSGQLSVVLWAEVSHCRFLPVAPQVLDGIQFGCIGRQAFQMDASLLSPDKLCDGAAPVHAQAIPDDQKVRGNVPHQCLQEGDHLLASDRAWVNLEVEVPPSHPRDRRETLPREPVLEDRRLTAASPRSNSVRPFREATLVDKDDGSGFPRGFFLMRGHSTRFQRAMASSFRSIARPVGRWQLQPMRTRNLHTCALWYRTPNSRSITSATRSQVHRFVAYPAASGPDSRMSPKRSTSSSLNRGLRPARPAPRRASTPFKSTSAAHRLTDCRCTPTRRATSACGTPALRSFAAFNRRRSNSSKSRCTPRGLPIPTI